MDNKSYEVMVDFRGSPDGSRVIDYKQGEKLVINTDFSEDLAEVALTEKWVKESNPKAKPKAAPKKKTAKK